MRQRAFAFLVVLSMSFSVLGDGFSYASYKPANISDVAKGVEEISRSDPSANWFMGTMDKRQLSVVYSSSIESLSEERKQFIKSYFKTVNVDPAMADLFDNDLLINVEGATYRLPVQTALIKHMQAELHPGDNVVLYVVVAGSAAKSGLVLLINEFDAPRPH